jgi:hypothetical protein
MVSKARAQSAHDRLVSLRLALRQLGQAFSDDLGKARNHVDPRLSVTGLEERRQELVVETRQSYLQQLVGIREQFGADVDAIHGWADQAGPQPTVDALQQGRLWDRSRMLLEAGWAIPDLINHTTDIDTLLVLRDELPTWVLAHSPRPRGMSGAGWTGPDTAGVVRAVNRRLIQLSTGDPKLALQWDDEVTVLAAETEPVLRYQEALAWAHADPAGGLQAAIESVIARHEAQAVYDPEVDDAMTPADERHRLPAS